MKTVLQISPSGARVADRYGDTAVSEPELMLHTRAELVFDLRGMVRGESGELEKFDFSGTQVSGWYFAIDRDYDSDTAPKLLITSGITFSVTENESLLSVPIADTGTPGLTADLNGKAQAKYTAELGALDSKGRNVFTWQFGITVKNRIYNGGASEYVPVDPDYYTALQINAMLNGKADTSNVYSRNDIDSMLNDKADTSNVYSRNDINSMLNDKADASNVYSRNDIDLILGSIAKELEEI